MVTRTVDMGDRAAARPFNILVTGAAGFIGSHTALELLNAGYEVIAIDNFSNAISVNGENKDAVSLQRVSQIAGKTLKFKTCDLLDATQLNQLFDHHKIDAVIHFAALKSVGESVAKPCDYYNNNIVGSLNLIQCCRAHGVKNFVFSSSATVYGNPKELPIKETSETGQSITNPYGQTKFMVERILIDLCSAEPDWKICILRYFNPVGAHPSGLIGEDPQVVADHSVKHVGMSMEGHLMSSFDLDLPINERPIRNDDYMHANTQWLPGWLEREIELGYTTRKAAFQLMRFEALKVLKNALGPKWLNLTADKWMTPAKEADANASLSRIVKRQLNYTSNEYSSFTGHATKRYLDEGSRRGVATREPCSGGPTERHLHGRQQGSPAGGRGECHRHGQRQGPANAERGRTTPHRRVRGALTDRSSSSESDGGEENEDDDDEEDE